jgi:hypothetical protein
MSHGIALGIINPLNYAPLYTISNTNMFESINQNAIEFSEFINTDAFVMVSFLAAMVFISFLAMCVVDYNNEYIDQRDEVLKEFNMILKKMHGSGRKKARYKLFDGLTKAVIDELEDLHRKDYKRKEMVMRYINRIMIKQKITKLEKNFGVDKNKNA